MNFCVIYTVSSLNIYQAGCHNGNAFPLGWGWLSPEPSWLPCPAPALSPPAEASCPPCCMSSLPPEAFSGSSPACQSRRWHLSRRCRSSSHLYVAQRAWLSKCAHFPSFDAFSTLAEVKGAVSTGCNLWQNNSNEDFHKSSAVIRTQFLAMTLAFQFCANFVTLA